MPPPRTSRLLVVAGGVAALAVAAVLVRPGTAVDEGTVAAAQASLAPVVAPDMAPSPDPGPADLVVRAEGVDGLRLGMSLAEVAAAGFSVQERAYDGCRRVLPGLADAGPGPGVAGWLVDGTVQSVTVDERAGRGPSFLGPGLGDRLADLPEGADPVRAPTSTTVPWQGDAVVGEVARVETGADRQASLADLSGDGVVDHVQLVTDAGSRCAAAAAQRTTAEEASLPVLTATGWGPVRIGTTLAEAATLVDLQPLVDLQRGRDDVATPAAARCRLVLADEEPGLVYLVVGPDPARPGDGQVVRGVAVDAGRTDTGLAVGDPAEQVQQAYPGITEAFLQDRWGQGLVAEWQLPDGVLRLAPTREQVGVVEVDGVLRGPRDVVGSVQLGPGC